MSIRSGRWKEKVGSACAGRPLLMFLSLFSKSGLVKNILRTVLVH